MTPPQLQQQPLDSPMPRGAAVPASAGPLHARLAELRQHHAALTGELAALDRERARHHAALLRLEGGIAALEEYAQQLAEGR